MKQRVSLRTRSMLLAFSLALGLQAANADEIDTPTVVGTSYNVESKLSDEFAVFLGGTEQAHAVVDGLRQGTAFLYVKPGSPDATIEPPTGTMGYGNVRITLRLAQAELGELGIVQPTAEELSAILLGGEIDGAPVDGILALRAEGMGWGQIAHQYGTTVGQLMGRGAGLTSHPHTPIQARAVDKTPADSTVGPAHATQTRANGYIPSGRGPGYGIVSATGESVSVIKPDRAKGAAHKAAIAYEHGGGMVSAGSQHASLAGAGNAGGGAKASPPGLARKN